MIVWGFASRFGLPLLDALFLTVLVFLLPLLSTLQVRLAAGPPPERLSAYQGSAVTLLVLGASAAALGLRSGGVEGLGIARFSLGAWALWSVGVTAAGALTVLAFHAFRRIAAIDESPWLIELLPRSPREKGWFAVLSLAAGFGEELALRGHALSALAPILGGPWAAAIFTSVVFGLLHAYQEPLGMARASVLGLLLAASVLLSGSLWPAIAAHVALDLLGGLVWGERLSQPVASSAPSR
jgi:membrane protease YdiL (CAAX protease family)